MVKSRRMRMYWLLIELDSLCLIWMVFTLLAFVERQRKRGKGERFLGND